MCILYAIFYGTYFYDIQKLHEDPLYIGRVKPRVTGPDYDAFLDEFMQAVSRRFETFTCLLIMYRNKLLHVFVFDLSLYLID